MADRLLCISWGRAVPGREGRSLEVFNEALGFYGTCQQDGRLESFDVVMLAPNAGMSGYMELHGTPDQLNALREDDEYRRILVDAMMVCDDVCVVEGSTGAEVARDVERFQGAISRVPQTA
jgi:hypothetical protein